MLLIVYNYSVYNGDQGNSKHYLPPPCPFKVYSPKNLKFLLPIVLSPPGAAPTENSSSTACGKIKYELFNIYIYQSSFYKSK